MCVSTEVAREKKEKLLSFSYNHFHPVTSLILDGLTSVKLEHLVRLLSWSVTNASKLLAIGKVNINITHILKVRRMANAITTIWFLLPNTIRKILLVGRIRVSYLTYKNTLKLSSNL